MKSLLKKLPPAVFIAAGAFLAGGIVLSLVGIATSL